MEQLDFVIGDPVAQKVFIDEYRDLLNYLPKLVATMQKVFQRNGRFLDKQELDEKESFGDGDSRKLALEDKLLARTFVFFLGRTAIEDFSELLILAGNGRGIGAYKILRGMFERVVTAKFFFKKPDESRIFVANFDYERYQVLKRLRDINPDTISKQYTPEEVSEMERLSNVSRDKHRESVCKTCGTPKTQEAWTRIDLATMAQAVGMKDLYGTSYLLWRQVWRQSTISNLSVTPISLAGPQIS